IEHADPAVYRALQDEFVRWDDIDIVHRGRTLTSGGHGIGLGGDGGRPDRRSWGGRTRTAFGRVLNRRTG
ncbi:hypothetical protein, partial [Streptomyces lunaelactis]|uniref:hypothetical protein n=1 Tax=Streptomyces lunaelactis TaxID=1535768 RepID=UPI001585C13C